MLTLLYAPWMISRAPIMNRLCSTSVGSKNDRYPNTGALGRCLPGVKSEITSHVSARSRAAFFGLSIYPVPISKIGQERNEEKLMMQLNWLVKLFAMETIELSNNGKAFQLTESQLYLFTGGRRTEDPLHFDPHS